MHRKPCYSIDIPMTNNDQFLRDDYKVYFIHPIFAFNALAAPRMPSFKIFKQSQNYQNFALIQMARRKHPGWLLVTSYHQGVEVIHPAARLLVMASRWAQESQMCDSTNMVIMLVGELLKNQRTFSLCASALAKSPRDTSSHVSLKVVERRYAETYMRHPIATICG